MDHHQPLTEQGETPENENHPENNMASLLEEEGLSFDFPQQGEIRQGVIASITPGQILVSVGTKSEGMITGREYDAIAHEELAALEVGQEVPVYVINPEDQNGNLVLSFVRARDEAGWQQVEELLTSRELQESTIIGYNKGGLIVPVGGLRGFVPASQVSFSRRAAMSGDTPEQRYAKMVGEPISVTVIEVDRERRRLILSERFASSESRESIKDKVLDSLQEGEIRTGRVTSLADFGAFVNISGADGLVHLSEISWDRIQHPNEVLKVGQEIKVKVINIDRDKKRIGLSLRALLDDPWSQRAEQFQVGQLIEAKITRLTKFGAFARLDDDLEGLIHISEISEKRIEHPKEVLKEGDTLALRIIRIDAENHRIGLSLKRVESMAYADMDWQTLLETETDLSNEPEAAEEAQVLKESEGFIEPELSPDMEEPSSTAVIEPASTEVEEPSSTEVEEPASTKVEKPASTEAEESPSTEVAVESDPAVIPEDTPEIES
jgi:small subunit ribosomal protein S1